MTLLRPILRPCTDVSERKHGTRLHPARSAGVELKGAMRFRMDRQSELNPRPRSGRLVKWGSARFRSLLRMRSVVEHFEHHGIVTFATER
jgi:hypothetical protein